MLVVLEPDVEEGLVTLHQFSFEMERLLLGMGDHVLEVGDRLGEGACLALHAGGGAEIGADAVAEVGSLADVDDVALGVAHDVDAGAGGDAGKLVGESGRGHDLILARDAIQP